VRQQADTRHRSQADVVARRANWLAKKPGGWKHPGYRALRIDGQNSDDAEYDRGNKREGEIGCDDAQSADESHGSSPLFTSLRALTRLSSEPFPSVKVSVAALSRSVRRNRNSKRG
jgi:hypothetical protein